MSESDTAYYLADREFWHQYLQRYHLVHLGDDENTTDKELLFKVCGEDSELLCAITAPPFEPRKIVYIPLLMKMAPFMNPTTCAMALALDDWNIEKCNVYGLRTIHYSSNLRDVVVKCLRSRCRQAFLTPHQEEYMWQKFCNDMKMPEWYTSLAHLRHRIIYSGCDWKLRCTEHSGKRVSSVGKAPSDSRRCEDLLDLLFNVKHARSFFVIKPPHKSQTYSTRDVLHFLEARGFLVRVFTGNAVSLTPEQVDCIYQEHVGKEWYEEQRAYMLSGPVTAGVAVYLPDPKRSSYTLRKEMGATDPAARHACSLRGMFARGRMRENVLHVADVDDAERQLKAARSWFFGASGAAEERPSFFSPISHTRAYD